LLNDAKEDSMKKETKRNGRRCREYGLSKAKKEEGKAKTNEEKIKTTSWWGGQGEEGSSRSEVYSSASLKGANRGYQGLSST
jgi:hypothetical protein